MGVMKVVLQDIVRSVAKAAHLTLPDAKAVTRRILQTLEEGILKGETIEIRDFGVFKTKVVSGRMGRDVVRGIPMALPPMRRLSFKPGKKLKPVIIKKPVLLKSGEEQLTLV
jgi:nucleoid DNA-binding protein